jgi:expansin (peptidoglycan-binding protein)
MPVAAISHELFDSWPGYKGGNPNLNPVCDKHIRVSYRGKSVVVQVTDRCPGCSERSLDLSPSAFEALAPLGLGRMADGYTQNLQWSWVQGSGRLPELPLDGNLDWPGLD